MNAWAKIAEILVRRSTEVNEQQAADNRWRKRVQVRYWNGKYQEFRAWLKTDPGQITLLSLALVLLIIGGVAEKNL